MISQGSFEKKRGWWIGRFSDVIGYFVWERANVNFRWASQLSLPSEKKRDSAILGLRNRSKHGEYRPPFSDDVARVGEDLDCSAADGADLLPGAV